MPPTRIASDIAIRRALPLRRSSICPASRPIRWRRARAKRTRRGLRDAVSSRVRECAGAGRRRCRACWPARTSRRSSPRSARRATAGSGDRLGPRRARDQDRPVAGPDRPDGARLRVGARDERRRRSSTTSRSRCRAATSEDVDAALGPGRFGMAEETGRALNARDQRRASRRARGSARRSAIACCAMAPPHAGAEHLLAAAARLGDPGDRARRHRHRHHPHAPGRVGRGARRGQPARLPLLRLERRAARAAACI